jgi:hypothetical protein
VCRGRGPLQGAQHGPGPVPAAGRAVGLRRFWVAPIAGALTGAVIYRALPSNGNED